MDNPGYGFHALITPRGIAGAITRASDRREVTLTEGEVRAFVLEFSSSGRNVETMRCWFEARCLTTAIERSTTAKAMPRTDELQEAA